MSKRGGRVLKFRQRTDLSPSLGDAGDRRSFPDPGDRFPAGTTRMSGREGRPMTARRPGGWTGEMTPGGLHDRPEDGGLAPWVEFLGVDARTMALAVFDTVREPLLVL